MYIYIHIYIYINIHSFIVIRCSFAMQEPLCVVSLRHRDVCVCLNIYMLTTHKGSCTAKQHLITNNTALGSQENTLREHLDHQSMNSDFHRSQICELHYLKENDPYCRYKRQAWKYSSNSMLHHGDELPPRTQSSKLLKRTISSTAQSTPYEPGDHLIYTKSAYNYIV